MSGGDELADALAAAEAELERTRAAIREAREQRAGARLTELAQELATVQAALAAAEKKNDDTEARIIELRERAAAMRLRIEAGRR